MQKGLSKPVIKPKCPDCVSKRADGENYYLSFSDDNGNLITGLTWSPTKGTKMARLVHICEDIISYANNKDINKNDLINSINKLTADLN